jgi:hypothetical protein
VAAAAAAAGWSKGGRTEGEAGLIPLALPRMPPSPPPAAAPAAAAAATVAAAARAE